MPELKEISPSMRAYHELAELKKEINKRINLIMMDLEDDLLERTTGEVVYTSPITGKRIVLREGK